jgi:putative ABC transport system ATP-binding protein
VAEGIILENVVKTYGSGDTAVHALRGVDMAVAKGEVVGLIGPSGSGKSTLLKCLGAVIEPTSGKMTIGDQCIYDNGWKVRDLRALRRDMIGFIFQAPYLIPFLDVTDNVALLPMLAGKPNAEARKMARDLLDALDVGHRAAAMPSQLSGGEQQRVAIARALINRPPVILADEPTAPLDGQRALAVVVCSTTWPGSSIPRSSSSLMMKRSSQPSSGSTIFETARRLRKHRVIMRQKHRFGIMT